ncbi:unnamed protein product [Oppiella nova]|uniref:N-acetyltransferase domain-containing protein n=1 Tax=Oppiella nova TaxID=334625 RepID=A0A7R9LR15_9ACAR|nr:unnamed protein product [Oppiella nova]CAG2166080.1 unnamed protein product [Oppiella nova]
MKYESYGKVQVNVSEDFAVIGGYCVKPEYQGHGIGNNIWNSGMAHMGDRNIGLIAANMKMFEIYRDRHHFKCIREPVLYMRGQLALDRDLIDHIKGVSLVAMNEDNVRDVIEYDQQVCGLDRSVMIEGFYKTADNVSLVAINDRNQVLGYCLIMETCYQGLQLVAPLYADNCQIAELLGHKCCLLLPLSKRNDVIIKCWKSDHKAIQLAKKLGLSEGIEQMGGYTKVIPQTNVGKMYSLGSTMFYVL